VAARGRLTLVGVPLFLWFSTRLFGGLRAALERGVRHGRAAPGGRWPSLLDLAMVLVAGHAARGERVSDDGSGLGANLEALALGTLLFFLIFQVPAAPANPLAHGPLASLFCAVASEIVKRLWPYRGALRDAQPPGLGRECRRVPPVPPVDLLHGLRLLLGGEVAETYDLMRMRGCSACSSG